MNNTTTRPTYPQQLESARKDILAALESGNRMTDSAIYAKCNGGIWNNITASIYALKMLIEEKVVTDTHEMVNGYISTHFHTLAK
jgi:hypothetical protein